MPAEVDGDTGRPGEGGGEWGGLRRRERETKIEDSHGPMKRRQRRQRSMVTQFVLGGGWWL